MKETSGKFISELRKCLENGTFAKLNLGNYKGVDDSLQKILVRPVKTKKGNRLLFQYRGRTNDRVENFDAGEAVSKIEGFLTSGFRTAHLFTTERDLQLLIGKRSAKITVAKPTFSTAKPLPHDREKKYLVDRHAYYLKALGITNDSVSIRADARDKWKQINKFVEILSGLYESSDLKGKPALNIVDMGSGKGYLTFAAYDHLVRTASDSDRAGTSSTVENSPPYEGGVAEALRSRGGSLPVRTASDSDRAGTSSTVENSPPYEGGVAEALRGRGGSLTSVQVTGVESRPYLVELCNQIARAGGYDGLRFVPSNIASFETDDIDILIALHACDTATDDALYKGITSNASIIIAAPCCHHEVKAQMKSPDLLAGILKHPVMHERTAETITDGLRSLLLEREGYKTKLFEFVATEHTPKNNMLVAVRSGRPANPAKIQHQIDDLKREFGITSQRLDSLLETS